MCPGSCPAPSRSIDGIIRHGSKLLYAFGEATVPKVTVITRKAYGGAYVVMNSQAHRRRFQLRLADRRDRGDGSGSRGQSPLPPRAGGIRTTPVALRNELNAHYEDLFASPYQAASRGYIDDVIEPARNPPLADPLARARAYQTGAHARAQAWKYPAMSDDEPLAAAAPVDRTGTNRRRIASALRRDADRRREIGAEPNARDVGITLGQDRRASEQPRTSLDEHRRRRNR